MTLTQDAGKLLMGVSAVTDPVPMAATEEAQDMEMYEAATLLGADGEMSDIKFAFVAQAEVVTAAE